MILQELVRYYERKLSEGDIAPPGFEHREIPYLIIIKKGGEFVRFQDTWQDEKKKRARRFLVPKAPKRANGIEANLLWDNSTYVLGLTGEGKETKPERVKLQKQAFYDKVAQIGAASQVSRVLAVQRFLETMKIKDLKGDPLWKEIAAACPNLTFKLVSDDDIICAQEEVFAAIQTIISANQGAGGLCLITGKKAPIARLHPSIQGVRGAQSSGASMVSFNLSAFESYGKEQSYNAPTSEAGAFGYTTALNALLGKDSRQKMQIGDATTIFWCGKKDPFEEDFASFFMEPQAEQEERNEAIGHEKLKQLYESPKSGKRTYFDDDNQFYVLGLSPNAARLSIRFWYSGSVREVAANIRQHFEDLRIDHALYESSYLSLSRILRSTAVLGDSDRVHPSLAGKTMQAILSGGQYPAILLSALLQRLRMDHKEESVRYNEHPRHALLKAFLNRRKRLASATTEYQYLEDNMDEKNTDPPYRLGRAFAVLESLQRAAIGQNINATIRDRYFAAASTRPAYVFPLLLAHAQHHISKSEGLGVVRDRQLQEILEPVVGFPRMMSLEQQGLFALGYYHQKQQLFKKKDVGQQATH